MHFKLERRQQNFGNRRQKVVTEDPIKASCDLARYFFIEMNEQMKRVLLVKPTLFSRAATWRHWFTLKACIVNLEIPN